MTGVQTCTLPIYPPPPLGGGDGGGVGLGAGDGDGAGLGAGAGAGLGVGDGLGLGVGAGAVVNVVGSTTSGSAVITSVTTVVLVSNVVSLLTVLATGTFTPLILASLDSKTLMLVPDLVEVPANFTPSLK